MALKCLSSYLIVLRQRLLSTGVFNIRPTRRVRPEPVQTGFYTKNYAFIGTPREELVKLPKYAFVDPVQPKFYIKNTHLLIFRVWRR